MTKKRSTTFGPVLRQLRDAKILSQEVVGEKAGVSGSFISALESGHKFPNLEMIFKLAEALELSPSELIREMEKQKR